MIHESPTNNNILHHDLKYFATEEFDQNQKRQNLEQTEKY